MESFEIVRYLGSDYEAVFHELWEMVTLSYLELETKGAIDIKNTGVLQHWLFHGCEFESWYSRLDRMIAKCH